MPTPKVTVTSLQVFVGEREYTFRSSQHHLCRIDIREEDGMNIMELTYEWLNNRIPEQREVRIPVPKGRLMEAISIQARLFQ